FHPCAPAWSRQHRLKSNAGCRRTTSNTRPSPRNAVVLSADAACEARPAHRRVCPAGFPSPNQEQLRYRRQGPHSSLWFLARPPALSLWPGGARILREIHPAGAAPGLSQASPRTQLRHFSAIPADAGKPKRESDSPDLPVQPQSFEAAKLKTRLPAEIKNPVRLAHIRSERPQGRGRGCVLSRGSKEPITAFHEESRW